MNDKLIKSLKEGDFDDHHLIAAIQLKGREMESLGKLARMVRYKYFPNNKVEVRSVIEISNICMQNCRYCNMGKSKNIKKYEIDKEEIINIIGYIYSLGRRRVLLQSGENDTDKYIDKVSETVYEIKCNYPDLVVILCIGSLYKKQYKQLRESGVDRYILKFETSNEKLFSYIKPGDSLSRRLTCIKDLIELGFSVGSGNIIGIPGQTLDDIVNDLKMIRDLDLNMNSTTVFIPAEDSSFYKEKPGDVDIALNVMALMRVMNPSRLMPTTSSLEKLRTDGQLMGLNYGANTVTIHDGTPDALSKLFPIYSTSRIAPNGQYFNDIVKKANMLF
jgi:biotin synthase